MKIISALFKNMQKKLSTFLFLFMKEISPPFSNLLSWISPTINGWLLGEGWNRISIPEVNEDGLFLDGPLLF